MFVNGEQLTGELEKADNAGITFKSPMAGEITVKWANIKDLRSSKSFAILLKNEKLTRKDAAAVVPQGTVVATDKTITVASQNGPRPIPIADTSLLIPAAEFHKAVAHSPTLLQGWSGAATGGFSLVRATQDSTTFTGGISLVRALPGVAWLPTRSRTLFDYNQAYGTVNQPGVSSVKSNIFHADVERDQYFSARAYAYVDAAFDHNFSQSLNLQQAYGGGIGMTVIKRPKQQLDIKADVHYEEQDFFVTSQNQNLIGSTFAETYVRHLPKSILFTEFGSISPAWNDSNDYSAHVNGSLVFPVYKGFGFNVSAVDDFLNNAPPGSNQNSTQFSTGITYTIKPR